MKTVISSAWNGASLLTYLQKELGLSSRMISRLKKHPEGMMLDGQRVTVRAILQSGSQLSLAAEDVRTPHPGVVLPVAPSLSLTVLLEDEDIILCNKPAGMPTHPSHGHFSDTLANALAYRHAQRIASSDDTPFVFHPITRLDRNTSGVVLIAKHALAAQRLTHAMMNHRIRKTYLALLCGVPLPPEGELITGIRRQRESIITREVTAIDAKNADRAHTQYQTLSVFSSPVGDPLCLVRAAPLTGRTHQLRLHFAHLGAPILGDSLYGQGVLPGVMERHALHSLSLTFPHPRDGKIITLSAPLAQDIRALLPDDIKDDALHFSSTH